MASDTEPHDVHCLSFHGTNIGEAFRNAGAWCADNHMDAVIVYGITTEEVGADKTYIDLFYLNDDPDTPQSQRRRR